jgi:hypothetical protein
MKNEVHLHAGGGRDYDIRQILSVTAEELPKSYILPELPDVLDQGTTQMCVAHAVAECMQMEFLKQTGVKLDFSVLMIYGLWRAEGDNSHGLYVNTALQKGREIGTVERRYAPGIMDVPGAIKEAATYAEGDFERYKVGSYYRIAKNGYFIDNVKRALYQFGVPLLVVSRKGGVSHAEVIVGWDSEGQFILQDSYGVERHNDGRHTQSEKNMKEVYLILMDEIKNPFVDIEGHWAEEDIKKMYHAGLIKGKTETEFCPDETMTRAEVATLLSRLTKKYDEIIEALESER